MSNKNVAKSSKNVVENSNINVDLSNKLEADIKKLNKLQDSGNTEAINELLSSITKTTNKIKKNSNKSVRKHNNINRLLTDLCISNNVNEIECNIKVKKIVTNTGAIKVIIQDYKVL